MSNSVTLPEKILDELARTGYPLEILVSRKLQARQWPVLHNPSYLDTVENISREYDIRAFHPWEIPSKSTQFSLAVYLIIECKKSEKPWVFFTTPEHHSHPLLGEVVKGRSKDKRIVTTKRSSEAFISDEVLKSFHHYFSTDRYARAYYEPFKGKESSDYSPMIFDAIMSVVNATLFMLSDRPFDRSFKVFYPVIVFDGIYSKPE